jgi:hypothetical protein
MRLSRNVIELLGVVLCFAVLFLTVVLPNSLRIVTAPLLVACFMVTLPYVHLPSIKTLLWLHCANSGVTILYMIIGLQNGAPMQAINQTMIVYVVSPIIWLFITSALLRLISDELLGRWFLFFTAASTMSVGLFYYLFLTAGADAVRFFIQDPNITFENGDATATMHVFGSMIFLAGGLFAAPGLISSPILKWTFYLSVLVACFASGRSALIMAPIVGYGIGFAYRRVNHDSISLKTILGGMIAIAIFLIVMPFLMIQMEINLLTILDNVRSEVREGGGTERREQLTELWWGIVESNGLGQGHGIGIDFIRCDEFPWRYELIWVATVLRVGFLGAIIYSLPFMFYIFRSLNNFRLHRLSDLDLYFFVAFLLAFIATNTNPYIEGFTFHWMYVVPLARAWHRFETAGEQRVVS